MIFCATLQTAEILYNLRHEGRYPRGNHASWGL